MILACHNIEKSFGEQVIVHDGSFHIEDREKAALVGVNGAGKSTILKMIMGEEPLDGGDIILAKGRTIGYLAQHQSLLSGSTIYEEVKSARADIFAMEEQLRSIEQELKSLSGDALKDRLETYNRLQSDFEARNGYACESEIVGVLKGLGFTEEEFGKRTDTLSGGQKTRVSLGKLLLTRPDILLLDEPTNHLDLNSIAWLETFLMNYPGAVFIVSHDRYFLNRVVTKVIEIERGEIRMYLGNYKAYAEKKQQLRDARLKEYLNQQRENNSRMVTVDRAVEDGDVAVIDYEGFADGEAFEGGKGENYSLTIGSHSFIDTFEEQLIGKKAGDDVEVNVTFPEQYHSKELAGKPALFKVSIKEVKEKQLPELDDEFASEVSDFETLAEYREDIKKKLGEKKEDDAKRAKEDAAVEAAIAGAQMDIPDAMVETQQRQMVDDFAQRLQMQGMNLDLYCQYTGQTVDSMLESVKPQALKRIQSRLVLEAVAAAEGITASEEDFEQEINRMAESYKMEADKVKEIMGENGKKQIMEDLAVSRAADFLRDNAVEVEKTEEE